MKSLFKITMLVTALAVALNVPLALADKTEAKDEVKLNSAFKTVEQQNSYALGASLGSYMENSLKEQKSLGINIEKAQLLAGVEDALNSKSKLTDKEIQGTLLAFENTVKEAARAKAEKESGENGAKGDKYRKEFAKQAGVVETKSGLLYKVEKEGTGKTPKETDTVVVNYKGALTDGLVFDSSYERKEPLSIRLDGVIPGWKEGLQHVKKGGKITLVIPPKLAYDQANLPKIPANSTLVFDVELLDIKPAAKAK
ncbi:FKBP-type peptidyl-prolyl cis-trans isomerase [Xenorhabdus nematophila]|uniref:Peptidyl-prolyl cis-trans isomerase n=1 Tax=Xenorhabdus nematophila (strain ATCC 19061 / DSM 3370 / CCUG 14189 / LMG 1036 / NCIMB 9965 / AN6) TaxID=406817 RepID=D3VED4_XENNA|nr:FKBP-type peptidyl-prolyl cis-trans isomerase [Xenorhabdus nematophila]CEE90882.1 FKBP-type peptidyl-prolyl cis-trans isomerase (rotamase) [Xenorhabdus nematophila str. Anatoliense]CEF29088.1 FKBP-type peptidyl-prolyl cis-trans isomerase (rotamase) [Xenorhabdus nematophila str. Websteri]AYA41883.1 FKBP-type peptidyl-prolyl cis-trans isomerase [Xenorhabdus nematophila]KHD29325.1 peptidylprolyl isomerase [Xenorhabdus nematophila]MBA0020613.1 FKBP-type peptidyl-prolyl cis-trans isomerase [Xeno